METQDSIAQWGRDTFGPPHSALSVALRMNIEMAELLAGLAPRSRADEEHPVNFPTLMKEVRTEVIDVWVMFCQVLFLLGIKAPVPSKPRERWPFPDRPLESALHIQRALTDLYLMLYSGASPVRPSVTSDQLLGVSASLGDLFRELTVKVGDQKTFQEALDEKVQVLRGRTWVRTETGRIQHAEKQLFVDPGSGLTMSTDLWYILSDSGSCYTSEGFRSPLEALDWWKLSPDAPEQLPIKPNWSQKHFNWTDAFEEANVVFGANVLDFWAHSKPNDTQEGKNV